MDTVRTKFLPSLHGFSFANSFPGYPLPSFITSFPCISKSFSSSSIRHGLCGGMCFASYDFFITKRVVTSNTTVPAPGSSLYRFLYQRQLDTYGMFWKYMAKFFQWTILPDVKVGRLTRYELQKVKCYLNAGHPVVLGLVYTSIYETLAIWLNHQVLAYNYSEGQEIDQINIYDPNYPGRNDIVIEIAKEPINFRCEQRGSNPKKKIHVRGFFVIPYVPAAPAV